MPKYQAPPPIVHEIGALLAIANELAEHNANSVRLIRAMEAIEETLERFRQTLSAKLTTFDDEDIADVVAKR